jgi:hypothetical protein
MVMKRLAGVSLFAAITLSFAFAAPLPPCSQLRPNEYPWHPETSPQGPVLMVISEADRQIVIFRNGEPIGRARFEMQGSYHFPTAVFSYLGRGNNQNRWLGIGRDAEETEKITSDNPSTWRCTKVRL